jgi:hypothetical protein
MQEASCGRMSAHLSIASTIRVRSARVASDRGFRSSPGSCTAAWRRAFAHGSNTIVARRHRVLPACGTDAPDNRMRHMPRRRIFTVRAAVAPKRCCGSSPVRATCGPARRQSIRRGCSAQPPASSTPRRRCGASSAASAAPTRHRWSHASRDRTQRSVGPQRPIDQPRARWSAPSARTGPGALVPGTWCSLHVEIEQDIAWKVRGPKNGADGCGQARLGGGETYDARVLQTQALAHAFDRAPACTDDVAGPVHITPVGHRNYEPCGAAERHHRGAVRAPAPAPDVVYHGQRWNEPGDGGHEGIGEYPVHTPHKSRETHGHGA